MKAQKVLCFFGLTAGLLASTHLAAAGTNLDLARQLNQAFIEVAEKVSPCVVVINVTEKTPTFSDGETTGDDPPASQRDLWRRFHQQFEDSIPYEGQGSGFIIRKDGYILTSRHVVNNAEKIEVRLQDGRTFKATLRGADPQSDVAVVKIDAENLPVATLADSSKTRVGEFAIAIGAPFNYDYSVTFGHVSAKGRSNVVPMFEGGNVMDQDFIQTDANINPGNSGGPLLNIEGEVIGINTMIRGLQTGIGFAVPSNLAKEISDKLIADGKFTRAWLGIVIRAVKDAPDFRSTTKGIDNGVIVEAIMPRGPAAGTELRPGDVITSVDGRPVNTAQQLRNEVRGKTVGHSVTLNVFRSGKNLQVKMKPGEFVDPGFVRAVPPARRDELTPTSGLGLTVHSLTPELADQFGVEVTEGVVVVAVERESLAGKKGIKPGDVITAIDRQPVASPKQFADALKKADLKKGVVVNLVNPDAARFEILKEGND
jgi:serine protease Do